MHENVPSPGSCGMSALTNSIPGVHSYLIGGVRFDIPEDYQPLEYVNRGAFGVVWCVRRVAIGARLFERLVMQTLPSAFATSTTTLAGLNSLMERMAGRLVRRGTLLAW